MGQAMKEQPGAGGSAELFRLAWPFILSNSLWTLQIALDRILLSRASTDSVGAAMAAAMLFWAPITLLQYTANYATTFVAQYTGAGQPHRVGPAVWQALYFSLLAGVAFLALIPLAEPLMLLGGHSAAMQQLEATYFRCLCFSALPLLVNAAASSFFAGRGASGIVLLINSAGLAVNLPLAYAWINGHGGFPAWGIAGAGWATVAGSSTSALLSLGLMLLPRYQHAFHTASGWRFDRDLFGRLLRYGLPNGLYVGLDTTAYTVFLFLLGRLGDVELAASSMAFTINLVSFLPTLGISQAVGVLVGQRLGENRAGLALRSTWTGLRVTLLYQAAMALVYLSLPGTLALVFRRADDAHWEEVAALVPLLLRFVAFYSFFDGANLVFSSALRGAGDTRFVTVVAVLLAWPVMVLPTWAAWQYGWGLTWAWTFATLYMVLLAVALVLRFRQGKWQRMRVIESAPVGLETGAGV
jgi:multidrug resistance protein, MATE family